MIIGILFDQTPHHDWLFVDFFKHEEWVRTFRNFTIINFNGEWLTFLNFAVNRFNVNGISRQGHDFLILQFNKLIGFTKHCQGIRSHHIKAFTTANQ